ncbi:hypothetical protein GPROT2_03582 [Gammaproteobacteria bacterium]|nr:hypothetical protein GPROT2_03582 [Gammaproteobacteria bacterium]
MELSRTARVVTRSISLIPLLAFCGVSSHAGIGVLSEEEPVNLIVETGQDVGPCPHGAALAYPPAPYKGTAYFLGRANGALAAKHDALTKNEAPWLRRLDGPSGANRLYTAPDGERALVFRSCKSHDCGANLAYGAYAIRSADYVLQLREGDKTRTLGRSSPKLQAAIACARMHDARRRSEVTHSLKTQAGK